MQLGHEWDLAGFQVCVFIKEPHSGPFHKERQCIFLFLELLGLSHGSAPDRVYWSSDILFHPKHQLHHLCSAAIS